MERRHADAVLWPETVYPTTLGHPKSAAGAALDREILDTVDAARVPFVIGTYDADATGEYNAAAFVEPGRGIVGMYRKTRLFPFTEHVPAWLDGPAFVKPGEPLEDILEGHVLRCSIIGQRGVEMRRLVIDGDAELIGRGKAPAHRQQRRGGDRHAARQHLPPRPHAGHLPQSTHVVPALAEQRELAR